jgi:outer membrane receptor protein involved in Fe transport
MARTDGDLPSAALLANAIRAVLDFGAAGLLFGGAPSAVLAQDPDAPAFDGPVIERVIVTGSRIARADNDGASPVTVIDRAATELTGMTDIGELLQRLDAAVYHDLVATYALPSFGLRLAAGITNLTDEPPPYIESGYDATTDPTTYRLFGRGYYLRLSWKL